VPRPQFHNGYMYACAHVVDVIGNNQHNLGRTLVDIHAGFEVAPGDASDVHVVNAHDWQCWSLTFSDGSFASTALHIAGAAWNPAFFHGILLLQSSMLNRNLESRYHMTTGKSDRDDCLIRSGARVAAKYINNDVLLRKKLPF
jgi:hypothetical protein